MSADALLGVTTWLLARYGRAGAANLLLVSGSEENVEVCLVDEVAGHSLDALLDAVDGAKSEHTSVDEVLELRSAPDLPGAPPPLPVVVSWERGRPPRLRSPLTVAFNEGSLTIEWDGTWCDEPTATSFGRRLAALLDAGLGNPAGDLRTVALLTDEERHRLLGEWAGSRFDRRAPASISEAFRKVVETRPDSIAVETVDASVTYRELSQWSERIILGLKAAGVVKGERVGLYLDRSPEMVASQLAILGVGGAYVPLDRNYPAERLASMTQDAEIRRVIARAADRDRILAIEAIAGGELTLIELEGMGPADVASGAVPPAELDGPESADPAYVMFTSGSTGRPKGVEVPHVAVLRLVLDNWFVRLVPGVRFLGFAAAAFDAATLEVWGPLLNGGTLVLAPGNLPSLRELAEFIEDRHITTAWLTAAIFRDLVEYHLPRLGGLQELLSGGDVLSPTHVERVHSAFPSVSVINGYGPTENTTFTTCHRVSADERLWPSVPIGRPIAGTRVYLLDEDGELVPPGMVGELYAAGEGLALGYVGAVDLIGDRFVELPFLPEGQRRAYRTGDLGRHLYTGVIEFLGRADDQVKIRGYRVEPAEIEGALLAHPMVRLACVVPVGASGERALMAAVVPTGDDWDERDVRSFLRARVPEYMVPALIRVMPDLPTTANGKVDRQSLVELGTETEPDGVAGEAPRDSDSASDWQRRISGIWKRMLPGTFGLDDAFFDVGGNSLLVLRFVEELHALTGRQISPVRLFEFPTIRRLAGFLGVGSTRDVGVPSGPQAVVSGARLDVAIIGMAGRFPGAATVDALWRLIRDGGEAVRLFGPDELDAAIDPEVLSDPGYVPVRGVLDEEQVECFDAEFFGIQGRTADIMDPQHRLLLELAWDAFEDAGRVPGTGGLTGVFVGVSHDTYQEYILSARPDARRLFGDLQILLGGDKDFAATRIAHALDLNGPAVAVQSASSTSLTALALATMSIRSGQCDQALAGGASVSVPWRAGQVHEEGAMFSRDGHTRAFDADASGTVFSDGGAMVLLKRLDLAERDGDRIMAVVRGVGVSNDGAERASFTAPTVSGQALCVALALKDAAWTADVVSYVEGHGTGTPLGDPIEMAALTRAFRETTERRNFCFVGSLKSNIGHLTAGAGVASLIKVLLALRHRFIPPAINFDAPNPQIDFDDSPFVVSRTGTPWVSEGAPRRAGISSFGAGGTNVHVLVEESPHIERPAEVSDRANLVILSGRTAEAVTRRAVQLADWIRHAIASGDDVDMGRVCRTLRSGRKAFAFRAAVAVTDPVEAAKRLDRVLPPRRPADDEPQVVFLLPGQGSQHIGMCDTLYDRFEEVRETIDTCADAVGPLHGYDLRDWLRGNVSVDDPEEGLASTAVAQPALFAVEVALARVLEAVGLKPACLVGHSLGELSAAALAGVMDIPDAARLVAARGRLMETAVRGSMMSVRAAVEDIEAMLPNNIAIAGENGPRLTVVSGSDQAIAAFATILDDNQVQHRELRVSHAFHSPSMHDAASAFEAEVARVPLRPPRVPFTSCTSGAWITDEQATDPGYWAAQIRQRVRFRDCIACPPDDAVYVEVGPRSVLTMLTRQGRAPGTRAASLLDPTEVEAVGELGAFLGALGALWSWGSAVDLEIVDPIPSGPPLSLPTYPYERVRHWIDAIETGASPRRDNKDGALAAEGDLGSRLAEIVQLQSSLLRRQLAIVGAGPRPDAAGERDK